MFDSRRYACSPSKIGRKLYYKQLDQRIALFHYFTDFVSPPHWRTFGLSHIKNNHLYHICMLLWWKQRYTMRFLTGERQIVQIMKKGTTLSSKNLTHINDMTEKQCFVMIPHCNRIAIIIILFGYSRKFHVTE